MTSREPIAQHAAHDDIDIARRLAEIHRRIRQLPQEQRDKVLTALERVVDVAIEHPAGARRPH